MAKKKINTEEILRENQAQSEPINEAFVTAYNRSLNEREVRLNEREASVVLKENGVKELLPSLDQKQAVIASKIAQNEEVLEKITKERAEIEKRWQELLAQKQQNEDLDIEIGKKLKLLKISQSDIDAQVAQNASLKAELEDRVEKLALQEKTLKAKQEEIDKTNRELNLQKSELELYQAKVNRLVTRYKLQEELKNA